MIQASTYVARDDMVIRDSYPHDLPYLRYLSKQESFALGWIPEQIYERVWGVRTPPFTGWILICEVNADPVGYCFAAPPSKPPFYGRIYQLAVQRDARRYQYGTFLADEAHRLIGDAHARGTTLRCAEDLPANDFWEVMGWRTVKNVPVGSAVGDSPRQTRRAINQRLKLFNGSLLPLEDSHA